jgi:hypothetical protein
MSTSLDPLKTTAPDLHRFWITIATERQWYSVMAEARSWFGKNWQCQNKIKRKLGPFSNNSPIVVWFDVPDPKWATWVATKTALQVVANDPKKANK